MSSVTALSIKPMLDYADDEIFSMTFDILFHNHVFKSHLPIHIKILTF